MLWLGFFVVVGGLWWLVRRTRQRAQEQWSARRRAEEEDRSFADRAGRVRDIAITRGVYGRVFFVALTLTPTLCARILRHSGRETGVKAVLARGFDRMAAGYARILAPSLRRACRCRKPAPGMLIQAAREMNIDLTRSYIIGDRYNDMEAGKKAGVKGILVKTGFGQRNSALADIYIRTKNHCKISPQKLSDS